MHTQKTKLNPIDVIIPSPVGKLGLSLTEGKLSAIQFLPQNEATKPEALAEIQQIIAELKAYFANPQHRFKLPFHLHGTPFQKTVWQALQQIPCGQTVSYQTLAQQLKTSPRAIGNACRRNPLPILVPCHRVVSKAGLGGFCGKTTGALVKIKQFLLNHETQS